MQSRTRKPVPKAVVLKVQPWTSNTSITSENLLEREIPGPT